VRAVIIPTNVVHIHIIPTNVIHIHIICWSPWRVRAVIIPTNVIHICCVHLYVCEYQTCWYAWEHACICPCMGVEALPLGLCDCQAVPLCSP